MKMRAFVVMLFLTAVFLLPILKDDLLQRVSDLDGGVAQIVYISETIRTHKQFPFWNPYINQGVPTVVDPINNYSNIIAFLPFLIFPTEAAIRISYFFMIAFGAFGMFWLIKSLSVEEKISILSALLYISGSYVASRIIAGHHMIFSSYSYIPFFLLSIVKLTKKQSLLWSFILGLSIVGMLFSGDIYSVWFSLLMLIIIGTIHWFHTKKSTFFFPIIIFFILGAVKILPMIECIPYFRKDYQLFEGTENIVSAFYYLFFPIRQIFGMLGLEHLTRTNFGWWEKASFIGPISLIGIYIALKDRKMYKKTWFRYFLVMFFIFLCILFQQSRLSPYHYLVLVFNQLTIFHVAPRAYSFISILLIIFSALGFDKLYKQRGNLGKNVVLFLLIINIATTAVLTYYLLLTRNVPLNPYHRDYIEALHSLEKNDPDIFYIAQDLITYTLPHYAFIQEEQKMLSSKYAFQLKDSPARSYALLFYNNSIESYSDIIPKYSLSVDPNSVFKEKDAVRLPDIHGLYVYRNPHYTPYISSARDVTDITSTNIGINRIDITALSKDEDILTILENYYPGWNVYVDGEKVPLVEKRFLSVSTQKGFHHYKFLFRPWSFVVGLCISILGFVIIICRLFRKAPFTKGFSDSKITR